MVTRVIRASVQTNWDDIPADGFGDPLAPGVYPVSIVSAEAQESKGDKTPMIKLELEAGDNKRKVFDYLVFKPKALWKIKNIASILGVELPTGDVDVGELATEICRAANATSLYAKLKVQAATEEYSASNKVDRYLSFEDAERQSARESGQIDEDNVTGIEAAAGGRRRGRRG